MIIWRDSIRISAGLKKIKKRRLFSIHHDGIEKLKDKISKGKHVFGVYCICFSTNPENLLDIIRVGELRMNHYKNLNITIIGLAESKEEAEELAAEMINEVYLHTGDFDIRSFYN